MRKILIFYGSYGGGHLSAAKSIGSMLENTYGKDIEVKLVDCIEYINKYLNKVSTDAYKEFAKKAPWLWKQVYQKSKTGALAHISTATNRLMSVKLNSLLQEFKPDLIVSTHPFSTQMCAMLKQKSKISCKLATVLTDYHIHPQWLVLYEYVDYFFVSNENMKSDMIKEGVDKTKIFVTGIPVSERFSGNFDNSLIYKEFDLVEDMPTILFFAGGEFGLGRNSTYMVFKALIRLFRNLQIVAIAGKNKRMNKKFNELVEIAHVSNRVKILEYTDKVPELMHIAMGVITKPGGLTITEALVSNLPILIINPIPGQEEENAEFLVENNVAIWIRKNDSIARTLKNISRNMNLLTDMKEHTLNLAKPNATLDICDILMSEFTDICKIPNKLIVTALIKYNNKFLFVKDNSEDSAYPNAILLVGGPVNNDESLENAIKREIKENVNLDVDNLVSYDFDSDVVKYKGKLSQLIFLRYTVEVKDISSIKNSLDNIELLWLSKSDLQKYSYSEPTNRFLKNLKLI